MRRSAPNLQGRIRRLESRLTDGTGLAPHSERWFTYWEDIFDRYMAGENPVHPGRFPLEVADRIVERADRADGLIP